MPVASNMIPQKWLEEQVSLFLNQLKASALEERLVALLEEGETWQVQVQVYRFIGPEHHFKTEVRPHAKMVIGGITWPRRGGE